MMKPPTCTAPASAPVTGEARAFYATLRGYSAVISSVLEEAALAVESESSSTVATATLLQFSRLKESQASALHRPAAWVDSLGR